MPNDDRYQQQRDSAIRAAATVFAQKGFHGASTRDIAEQMGIKQGSLYYYFKSKEEALHEVCLFGIREYVDRMQRIATSARSFEARLFACITSHLSSYRERDEAFKVYNDERLYLPQERRAGLKALGSGYRQLLERMLLEAQEAGELHESMDCHRAAQSLIALCNGWGHLIVRDTQLDLFEVVQHCNDLLLTGLLKRPAEAGD